MPKIKKIKDIFDQSILRKPMLFDLPFRVGIIGRSGSGKSNMMINLLDNGFYKKDFDKDNIYIVSGSLATDDKIKNLVEDRDIPLENLYNGYNEGEMTELYDNLANNYRVALFEGRKPEHSLIIMDDISFSGSLKDKQHGIISKLACNSRKFLVSLIFTAQKYSQISTTSRENMTGLISASCSDKQLELVSSDFNYMGCQKKFRNVFRKLTDNKFTFFICNLSNEKENRYMDGDFTPICVCDEIKQCKNKVID